MYYLVDVSTATCQEDKAERFLWGFYGKNLTRIENTKVGSPLEHVPMQAF